MSKKNSKEILDEYKLVLGLEIHLHLNTKYKMFCGCDADIYSSDPNTHTCPTCLGLPGALPVPNAEAVTKTQMLGLALNGLVFKDSKFDRKHYFYPDLPKGYQISQYEQPLVGEAYMDMSDGSRVHIERIHLEEDTAKSFHEDKNTLIDFNKSGMPLVEIVTKPTFNSVEQAVEFSRKLQDLVRYMCISNANMELGQMRIEPNISLRTPEMERNNKLPDYKVEVKNINSFKFMEKAVKVEIIRQKSLLQKGEKILQENRGFDEKRGKTVAQRSKEDAQDYRYFPEPDIPPMVFDDKYFEDLRKNMPELPWELKERLKRQYSLNENNAEYLSTFPGLDYIEEFELHAASNIEPNTVANLILNNLEYRGLDKKEFLQKYKDQSEKLEDVDKLLEMVKQAISENPQAEADYRDGKETAAKFLLGQVMRKTRGKAEPSKTLELIKNELS